MVPKAVRWAGREEMEQRRDEIVDLLHRRGFEHVYTSKSTANGNSYYIKVMSNDFRRELATEFWNMARDLFAGKVKEIEKLSAEDFADMALGDLLRGFDPRGEGGEPRLAAETRARDKAYMEAVKRGDMETAQRMVEAEARRKGYMDDNDYRMRHTAPSGRDGFSKSIDDPSGIYPENLRSPYLKRAKSSQRTNSRREPKCNICSTNRNYTSYK